MKIFLLSLMACCVMHGEDLYIAQSSAGSADGSSCANAFAVTFFNTSGNWGAGAGKISAGDTVHLCGAFTGTAGQTMLTAQGSGTGGNPITILFESGASLAAPYWGGQFHGAIDFISVSNIIVDGGINGIIQNTANGSALANQQYSQGIYMSTPINIEIRNLTIQAIYVNGGSDPAATDVGGTEADDIRVEAPVSNLLIHNNTLLAARAGIRVDFDSSSLSTLSIYNNYIADHCWGIALAAGGGGETTSGVSVYGNELTDWNNWQCPASSVFCNNSVVDAYHTDGVILYSVRGSPITASLYNNYIHGTLGAGSPTAFIFCTEGGGSSGIGSTCNIFNNVLAETSGRKANWMLATGVFTGNHQIYNNTLVGQDNTAGIALLLGGTNLLLKNNLVSSKQFGIGSYELTAGTIFSGFSSSNYNVWYNLAAGSEFYFNDGGTFYTYSAWTGLGYDANSVTGNPNLTSDYRPQFGSSAIGAGTNLTSLGISALNLDALGRSRPASAAWDIGAFNYAPAVIKGVSASQSAGASGAVN